jgi:hypothetical protein
MSRTIVTGPSLTSSSAIRAPKAPVVAEAIPAARACWLDDFTLEQLRSLAAALVIVALLEGQRGEYRYGDQHEGRREGGHKQASVSTADPDETPYRDHPEWDRCE